MSLSQLLILANAARLQHDKKQIAKMGFKYGMKTKQKTERLATSCPNIGKSQ